MVNGVTSVVTADEFPQAGWPDVGDPWKVRSPATGDTSIMNHCYLFAFDLKRQARRTFALPRLTSPELPPQRFTQPKNFDHNESFRDRK